MPDFHIDGNPGAVRSRAATTRSKAELFMSTGDALAKITTDGWNSRAADRFREKFDTEPDRWRESGDGFITAAGALEAYADALQDAQSRAKWAEGEYARGEQVTRDAKASYDADVSQARDKAHAAAAAGQVMTLTIIPFHDPGEAIRQGALKEYASAKSDLEAAAHLCADGVRAGCAAAPEKRKWYESVGAAVGGFLKGAGEALMDLGKLAMFLTNPATYLFNDMMSDAASGMTSEEIAAKYKLKLEDAQGMLDALQKDPLEFGKNLGKAVLDWDTWSDDPARALGHLLPDAIAAVFTAGAGTAATRGAEGRHRPAQGPEGHVPARRPRRPPPSRRPRGGQRLPQAGRRAGPGGRQGLGRRGRPPDAGGERGRGLLPARRQPRRSSPSPPTCSASPTGRAAASRGWTSGSRARSPSSGSWPPSSRSPTPPGSTTRWRT